MAPQGVVVARNGDVYVADSGLANIVKVPGGTGTPVGIGSGLSGPRSLFLTSSGDLFVADTNNGAIKKFPGASGANITTVASGFASPQSLWVTNSGDIYVADDKRAKRIFPNGTVITLATFQWAVTGIAVAPTNGDLYVMEPSASCVWKFPGGNGPKVCAAGGANAPNDNIYVPYAVWVSTGGDVYLTENGSSWVLKWPGGTGAMSFVPGAYQAPAGVFADC